MKRSNSPVTQHSDTPQQNISDSPSISKFFKECSFCICAKHCSKMLDFDAIVDLGKNIAYPVVFNLGKEKRVKKIGMGRQNKSG
jgi:thermostable 8-oxoguanine DNA glycosylase